MKQTNKRTTVSLKPVIIKKADELLQEYNMRFNVSLNRTQVIELLVNEAYGELLARK
ncbi:hypothetical protein [Bacillus massiliigorillae]|uniref:hypothetical protein n=1 Tax=Bacillus massiliigorillae TaxID=1243664 RepID=UPI0003AB0F93|nr:hypothetical protein [Bacillus massiliigorillae]